MKKFDAVSIHDREAAQYDQQVFESDSYGHDVLFGMSFEYVKPGECLLDIGIGTGLASQSFATAGLDVFGCDGSIEMLKICETKALAKGLQVFDLRLKPLPYPENFFDHVICCGVLHFFAELETILAEVSRIIKPGGVFAFSVATQNSDEEEAVNARQHGYLEEATPWGVSIFKHSSGYIRNLLLANCFEMLKKQKILLSGGDKDDGEDLVFTMYVSKS